ncbi:MAG TPA: Smr/MutS family protein [Thermoanaerobaculia bacterium]|nr:Smr/MutS family protein [Thermoanaerobaculia bacterium]
MTNDSLSPLEFDRVLALIALDAKSAPGKAAVANRRPLPSLAACDLAQVQLAEMLRLYHRDGLLPLAGLTEVAPLLRGEDVLDLDQSWQVVRAVRATQALREALDRSEDFLRLRALAATIPDLAGLVTRTGKYFTRDGKLREEASAELRAIRVRIHTKRAAIQRMLTEIMNRNAEAIQEPLIVMRGERYCIPVRSDHRNAVPGILHERSGSGASFFIEPMPAIELNNDLADLLIQEREEIARILRFISQMLAEEAGEIVAAVAAAGEIDALQACAVFGDTIRSARPDFSVARELNLIEARHPLLDERLAAARQDAFGEQPSGRDVVPVSLRLDGHAAALIVSGPNAGGKTVALKTAGLLVAMGMSGLPVPAAEGTVLPVVDGLHVLVGDDQSVLEHLSTFSAYLVRLKRVLARATERSLVLLDELGSGTDPEEGAALAAATIEHFLSAGSLLIVTTHLSALKGFAVNDPRIVNASMEFDSATGQSTYRMITGIPGRSRAIEVAESIGLPSSIIAAARERLGDRYGETDRMLAALQRRMSEVLAQQDEAARMREELEAARRAAAEAAEKLEGERKRVGTSFRDELERVKDDVSRQVTAEIRNLRESERIERVNAAEVLRSVTRPLEKAIEFIPAEQRQVHAGEKAEHRKFKITGQVVSIAGKKAVLDVNGRKMTVELSDLVPKGGAKAAPPPSRKRTSAAVQSDAVQVTAELNLIGQRVEEALDESDRFLDRALLEGKQAVRIIHGFGTGTLRKAIREHLRKHPAVVSWRPGGENEGGDGATIAVLS